MKEKQSAAEILQSLTSARGAKPTLPTYVSAKHAMAYWARMVRYHYDINLPALTRKEVGQLQQICRRCDGRQRVLFEQVLGDWKGFQLRAESVTGITAPAIPHIGYLLKHIAVALTWAEERLEAPKTTQSTTPPPKPAKEPINASQGVSEKAQDDPYAGMTMDEIMRSMNGEG